MVDTFPLPVFHDVEKFTSPVFSIDEQPTSKMLRRMIAMSGTRKLSTISVISRLELKELLDGHFTVLDQVKMSLSQCNHVLIGETEERTIDCEAR